MQTDPFDSEYVLQHLEKLLVDCKFPKDKLRNRLINLGLRELIDGDYTDASKAYRVRAIEKHGFPFKFHTPLDEAIMALAFYLKRLKEERGSLKIYAINCLLKGQDKNLAYWQASKAKLYIELQNLILLLNEFEGRTAQVTRILAFRDMDDIAYLTQAGIGALSEQLAIGIKTGFLFLDTFKHENLTHIAPITNTLLVEFESGSSDVKTPPESNAYLLIDKTRSEHLPYEQRGIAKWFDNFDIAASSEPYLSDLHSLFDDNQWQEFHQDKKTSICKFPKEGTAFFNRAAVMMYRAAEGQSNQKELINKFTNSVITSDFIELERAMTAFDNSENIWAVDATSYKNSLAIHLANPIYRHWIRKSVNRVLKAALKEQSRTTMKTLSRIYILKDEGMDADSEFQAIMQIMQYYFDYFHFEISELSTILEAHQREGNSSTQRTIKDSEGLRAVWNTLNERIHIYLTTSSLLKEITPGSASQDDIKMFTNILSIAPPSTEDANECLAQLDYLYTDEMIYNFKDHRADPGEHKFEADLFRKSLEVTNENAVLFRLSPDSNLKPLTDVLFGNRMTVLAKSILGYRNQYESLLEKEIEKYDEQIVEIEHKIRQEQPLDLSRKTLLLHIKSEFEKKLYEDFRPKLDHLFNRVKSRSVEVNLFEDRQIESVQNLTLFQDCQTMNQLSQRLREELLKNPPAVLDDANDQGGNPPADNSDPILDGLG